VYFFANNFFFIFFTFICLQQPSFAFIGEGSEWGFWGIFGRPARAAWAGRSRLRLPPLPAPWRDELPESKLTVPTPLMLEDLIIGANFCQGRVEEKAFS
jgi:hypothetical protein